MIDTQASGSKTRRSLLYSRRIAIAFVVATTMSWSASAEVIFSQAHTPYTSAIGSDLDAIWGAGAQCFDDLTLLSSTTVQSVTWWGTLGFSGTPVTPVSFELIFYGDADGLPDTGNVISATAVSFASLTRTGFQINEREVYEFQADVTPTALPGGTKVWFSVLADTRNDSDDDFLWAAEWFQDASSGTMASRAPLTETEPFDVYNGMQLFVLDDAPIFEPAELTPARISSIHYTGGTVTFGISNITVGAMHNILQTESLVHPLWSTSGTFVAGSVMTNWSSAMPETRLYYRIKSEK